MRGPTVGELLAVIASEASEHPYIGSERQKAAWDEIKARFAALEKVGVLASDCEMARAPEPQQASEPTFSLVALRNKAMRESPASDAVTITAEQLLALLAVLEAAEGFIEARWLGSREALQKAVDRFRFDA